MADTIVRPPQAGTRETDDYSASFNKEKLSNLKGMFEQKKNATQSEAKKFVPDFTRTPTTGKVATSSVSQPVERDPTIIYTVAGEREVADYKPSVSISSARSMFEQAKPAEYKPKNKFATPGKIKIPRASGDTEIVRNADVTDDRPKELTTSLLSARAMFEGGNTPTNNNLVKEVADWEGKNGANVLNSAKAVFDKKSDEKESTEKVVETEPAPVEQVEQEIAASPSPAPASPEPEPVQAEVVAAEEPVPETNDNTEQEEQQVQAEEVVVEEKAQQEEEAEEAIDSAATPVEEEPENNTTLAEEAVMPETEAHEITTPTPDENETEINPEAVEQPPTDTLQHSESTQPSVLPIDETEAATTVEPTPEVEEKPLASQTLEVTSPENQALEPSPAKRATQTSNNQSKDDDYDSADVLSDGATTTSQEGENNQK